MTRRSYGIRRRRRTVMRMRGEGVEGLDEEEEEEEEEKKKIED